MLKPEDIFRPEAWQDVIVAETFKQYDMKPRKSESETEGVFGVCSFER